jgi:hypothetical protein
VTTFYRDMVRPETEQPHFHVSLFQVGCLSDSDNGPYETAEDAISFATDLVDQMNCEIEPDDMLDIDGYVETDTFDGQLKRWQRRTYVIAVEQCDFALKYCGEYPE